MHVDSKELLSTSTFYLKYEELCEYLVATTPTKHQYLVQGAPQGGVTKRQGRILDNDFETVYVIRLDALTPK